MSLDESQPYYSIYKIYTYIQVTYSALREQGLETQAKRHTFGYFLLLSSSLGLGVNYDSII